MMPRSRRARRLRWNTLLPNSNIGFETRRQGGVSLRRKAHVGNGVGVVVVLPSELMISSGLKIRENRKHRVIECIQEPFFGGPCGQGDINGSADRGRAAQFIIETGPRIQSSAVLMHGDE